MTEKRICSRKNCNKEIPKTKVRQVKYCSHQCRNLSFKEKYLSSKTALIGLTKGKTGAISELKVCVDLLTKGYDAFRAVSASCPCDLVILKNKHLYSVEVKTALKKKNGNLITPNANIQADIVAAVFDTEILYTPPLDLFI